MTHVKNVEAFSRLVGFCTGYGGKYNPGQPNLQVSVLLTNISAAQEALERVVIAKSLLDKAVNKRKVEFNALAKLATGVLLTLQASGAKQESIEDARQYVRHIAGYSKGRKALPAEQTEEAKPRKTSLVMAFASKAEWFSKLVKAVEAEPMYKTNIAMYEKTALAVKVQYMMKLNKEVLETRIAWANARVERNKILYSNADSIYQTAVNVKKIVRSLFGMNSEEYKQLIPLTIGKPGK